MFKKGILFIIRIYQRIFSFDQGIFSFLLKKSENSFTSSKICRFYPTCSEYAYQAIDKYGIKKGSVLGIKRLFKCHPFHAGGYDPLV